MGENTQNTAGTPIRRPGCCVSGSAMVPCIARLSKETLEPAPKMLRESGSYFRPPRRNG